MGEIRSRENHNIPVSADANGKVERAVLIPNQWVPVPDSIYANMKRKFDLPSGNMRDVPDYDANERNPHPKDGRTITREESRPGYILEFRD